MSAATSQPLVGQSKSAAPFGAVALIAGVLTIGAIGIALGQNAKVTPAAGAVPADVQAALIAQRMGEKASLAPAADARLIQHQAELADRLGAYGTSDPRLIQHLGELQDRVSAAVVYGSIKTPDGLIFGRPQATSGTTVTSDGRIVGAPRAIPVKPSVHVLPDGRIIPLGPSTVAGPKTAAQKGLAPVSTYSGKVMDPVRVSAADPGFNEWAVREAARYGTVSNRWTVLATNPYAQGLLSRTVSAPATFATGGVRFNHR
jgi:hypothetical protein